MLPENFKEQLALSAIRVAAMNCIDGLSIGARIACSGKKNANDFDSFVAHLLSVATIVMLVKHVILTSSIAAVTFNGRLLTPKEVVDDTWFFDHELCKESKEKKPYSNKVAKLKAEYEKAMESYNAAEAGREKGEGEGEHEEG
ncbi:NAD-dependent epimerase/dehydratase [Arachis hypogaea]|uniref:NAD-dependent epimerase/dehydratase n=1 Tax=Arachis hypogaea TaxID=3818 RepID=A0A6B9V8J0_ARAHY|nr:NAD-dependent epimerase/dehydratase [Arachis hypogaea]